MGDVIRLERVFNVKITLVTNSLINYVGKDGVTRFAYYDNDSPVMVATFKKAILEQIPVNMLIERIQKGKLYDYVREVELAETS